MWLHPEGVIQDLLFLLLLKDDLSISRVSGVPLRSPLSRPLSRSAWYVLFILMWWIQGVIPATLTAIGVVRTTEHGPFQRGAKESCFHSSTRT